MMPIKIFPQLPTSQILRWAHIVLQGVEICILKQEEVIALNREVWATYAGSLLREI